MNQQTVGACQATALPDWSTVESVEARRALEAAVGAFDMARKWTRLSAYEDRVWRTIIATYARTGKAPEPERLSSETQIPMDTVLPTLDQLRARDMIVLAKDGRVTGAYPFSDETTGHHVRIGKQVVAAMCAIDALGVGAMLHIDTEIRSACAQCGAPIAVTTAADGRRLELVAPRPAVVWSGTQYADGCGATSLCRVQAFFCSEDHLNLWRDSGARGFRLSVEEAFQVGRAIFGKMLDPCAPTSPESTITCPACGTVKTEVMPTDACQFFYECTGCGTLLRPKPGHCCVFCSYGSVPCPPVQAARSGRNEVGCC